jgi:hypothetical protein
MHRSYPSALRIQQRVRFRRRVLAGAFAGLAVSAVAFAMTLERDAFPAASPDVEVQATVAAAPAAAAPVAATAPPLRRAYRYSIVPGGAANQAELARIVRSDKVVAAHYAGFDVDKARPVTVAAPRAVYVSYRKGDKVYWTAKKVMLQAGETLLTDGANEMRARCANRISDLPRFPVETHPPRPEALDALEDGQTEGEIAYVSVPEEAEPGGLPRFADQSYQPVWPLAGNPPPADNPAPAPVPLPGAREPGLPWPQLVWLGKPGVPPQSGSTPGTPRLPAVAPPVSGAVTVPPDPFPGLDAGDPLVLTPTTSDPGPLIPKPDPGRPVPPSSPALDLPPPADVPEPATPWLLAAALVAMRTLRRKP